MWFLLSLVNEKLCNWAVVTGINLDPQCSRTMAGPFTNCSENPKWLFVQTWGADILSGQGLTLPRRQQRARPYLSGAEKGPLALVRLWVIFLATWLVPPPEWNEHMWSGLGGAFRGWKTPTLSPWGGPPARCACSPGARCGAAGLAGQPRHRLRSSCTCSSCALPPRQWWSETQKTSKPNSAAAFPATGGV